MGVIFQRNKLKHFKNAKGNVSKPVDVMKVTTEIASCRVIVTKLVNERTYKNNSNPEVVKIKQHSSRNTWMGR